MGVRNREICMNVEGVCEKIQYVRRTQEKPEDGGWSGIFFPFRPLRISNGIASLLLCATLINVKSSFVLMFFRCGHSEGTFCYSSPKTSTYYNCNAQCQLYQGLIPYFSFELHSGNTKNFPGTC